MTTQDSNNEGPGDPTVTPFRDVNAETMQRRIADDLRQARHARGMDLRETADALRIRAVYLEALEDGRFGDLPGPTYVAGFLRTYGDALGLDGAELVRRYKDDTGGVLARQNLNFPVPASEARQPTAAILIITLVLGLIVFAAWYVYKEGMLVDLERVPEVPASIDTGTSGAADTGLAAIDDATPDEPAEVVEEVAEPEPEAGFEAENIATDETDSPEIAAGAEDAMVTEEAAAETVMEMPEEAQMETEDTVTATDLAEETQEAEAIGDDSLAETEALLSEESGYIPRIYGRTNTDSRVEIRATEETWIQVEAPDNEILLTRVLLPGDIYRVPNRADVTLDTGNSGGLEVKVDGKAIGLLGEPGVVVRNVSLSAEELLSR